MMRAERKSLIVVAQHAAPVLVFLAAAIFSGCASRRIANDYRFDVIGVVTTQDDTPLPGADVTLEVNGPVYEGVDLVKTRHVQTNDGGGFIFAFITDERGGKYTLKVRKDGFEPATVSGGAPPVGNHRIKLRKTAEPSKSDPTGNPPPSHYSLPTTHYPLVGAPQ